MKQQGITQEVAAEKMGVHRVSIARWVAGTMEPRMEQLLVLADYFGVSTDYLIKGVAQGPLPVGPAPLTEEEILWISAHRELVTSLINLPKGKIRLVSDLVDALSVKSSCMPMD